MRLDVAEPGLAAAGARCVPFGAVSECSGGRVVGALTIVSLCSWSFLGSQIGGGARKNPRQLGCCTRVARRCCWLCPGEGKRGINALPNYYEHSRGLHNT